MALNSRLLKSSRLWLRSLRRMSSTKFSDLHQDLMIKAVAEKSQVPETDIEPRLRALMASRVDKLESKQIQNLIKILSHDPANHYVWVKVSCE